MFALSGPPALLSRSGAPRSPHVVTTVTIARRRQCARKPSWAVAAGGPTLAAVCQVDRTSRLIGAPQCGPYASPWSVALPGETHEEGSSGDRDVRPGHGCAGRGPALVRWPGR